MTPAEFKHARKSLGFTQAELAAHIGRSKQIVGMWERGLVDVDTLAGLYVELLAACQQAKPGGENERS